MLSFGVAVMIVIEKEEMEEMEERWRAGETPASLYYFEML